MLHINDLTFRYGGRAIFERATLAVPAGHRVGLVGRNGSGKSTLLALIRGELHPDQGSINLPARARVGHLAQQAPDGPMSLIDYVLAADAERAALLAEAETAHESGRIAEIHDRLATIRADAAPARAATILAGLGFDQAAQRRPLSDFSGGWRMRVALAAALFAEPDLLLLDEPSNHLDLEARLWLESFLAAFPGTLILVSHDRELLNAVVEEIVHIDAGKLALYRGDYDAFERARAERLALRAAELAKQTAQRRHLQEFVDRFRYKASKARQAQSRIKMLERMGPPAAVARDEEIAFDFPNPEILPPPLVTLEQCAAGYAPDKPVLKRLDLRIDMDDRIGLLGPNGNGKSTLLKLLARRLEPLAGRIGRSSKLRVGYFDQEQAQAFDPALTAYRHMAQTMPERTETAVRAHLGRFGLSQDRADRRVGELSGGERARLLFALITRDAPHLLLLDEPTNHLDLEARDALIAALNAYDGAVILVSHDPRLIAASCDRLWLVADGTCRPFDGDLDDYRRRVAEERKPEGRPGNRDSRKPRGTEPSRKDGRRAAAQARLRLKPLRDAAEAAERELERLHREKGSLEAALADPAVYAAAPERAREATRRLAEVSRRLEAAEAAWLDAHSALEQGVAGES
jgi:ATP-binding cassette subfamily F protein 3